MLFPMLLLTLPILPLLECSIYLYNTEDSSGVDHWTRFLCNVMITRKFAMPMVRITHSDLSGPITSALTLCCTSGDRHWTRRKSMRIIFVNRSIPTKGNGLYVNASMNSLSERTVINWNSMNVKTMSTGAWTVRAFLTSTFSMASMIVWICPMRSSLSIMQTAHRRQLVSNATIECVLQMNGHAATVNVWQNMILISSSFLLIAEIGEISSFGVNVSTKRIYKRIPMDDFLNTWRMLHIVSITTVLIFSCAQDLTRRTSTILAEKIAVFVSNCTETTARMLIWSATRMAHSLRHTCFNTIRLARKFLRFFDISFFISFSFLRELVLNYVCAIGIYDSSPTIWERKNAALVEVCRLLGEKVGDVDFKVLLFIEFFFAQLVRQRAKQVIVCWSQVWRIRWMGNGYPTKL